MDAAPDHRTFPPLPRAGADPVSLRPPPDGALALALTEWALEAGPAGFIYLAREDAALAEFAAMARGFAPELDSASPARLGCAAL